MRHGSHPQRFWGLQLNFLSLVFVSNFVPTIYLFILILQFWNKLLYFRISCRCESLLVDQSIKGSDQDQNDVCVMPQWIF